jgi:AcrR family transcriptional regulator
MVTFIMAAKRAEKPASTPTTVSLQKSEPQSRREILDAAARLLRTQGYKATTLRDIAETVGIKAGSIYYHFSSKDEIVAAVMNEGVDRVYDAVTVALRRLPSSSNQRERLVAAIAAHLSALLEHSDYTSAGLKSYTDAPEEVRAAARQHRRRYEGIWTQLINELVASKSCPDNVSPATLRRAALGMMNWSPEWYRSGRHSINTLAKEFAEILLR